MPAFRDAAAKGFVLELDVKLTPDNVPVVIHDADAGPGHRVHGRGRLPHARPARGLSGGHPGHRRQLRRPTPSPEPIPTLEQVLELAREQRARVNIEIKNQPDGPRLRRQARASPTGSWTAWSPRRSRAARRSSRASCRPTSSVAKNRFPAAETSFLQLGRWTAGGIAAGQERRPRLGLVRRGHRGADRGRAHRRPPGGAVHARQLEADIKAAAAAGVDELITNDPTLARRALAEVDPPAPAVPAAPSAEPTASGCGPSAPCPPWRPSTPGPQAPRVFAIQFKQEARHIETYATFRTKMECLVRDFVLPRLARGRPNVVALNEDVGLLTIATGSRGRVAREVFADGSPGCQGQPRRAARSRRWAVTAVRAGDRRLRHPLHLEQAAGHRLLRGHRHLRPRLDAGVLGPQQALRRLHAGVEQPGPLPGVDQRLGDRPVPRPRHRHARLGVRGAGRPDLQRGLHVGPRGPADRGPADAAQRGGPEPQGAADRHRERAAVRTGTVDRRRRGREPASLRAARKRRAHLLRHLAAGLHLRAGRAATRARTPPRPTCAAWTAWARTW